MKPKKSWREMLDDSKDLPKVEAIPDRMAAKWGTGTLVIPAPREVDEAMRAIPKGKLTTINQIREALAKKHGATIGCPMTTVNRQKQRLEAEGHRVVKKGKHLVVADLDDSLFAFSNK